MHHSNVGGGRSRSPPQRHESYYDMAYNGTYELECPRPPPRDPFSDPRVFQIRYELEALLRDMARAQNEQAAEASGSRHARREEDRRRRAVDESKRVVEDKRRLLEAKARALMLAERDMASCEREEERQQSRTDEKVGERDRLRTKTAALRNTIELAERVVLEEQRSYESAIQAPKKSLSESEPRVGEEFELAADGNADVFEDAAEKPEASAMPDVDATSADPTPTTGIIDEYLRRHKDLALGMDEPAEAEGVDPVAASTVEHIPAHLAEAKVVETSSLFLHTLESVASRSAPPELGRFQGIQADREATDASDRTGASSFFTASSGLGSAPWGSVPSSPAPVQIMPSVPSDEWMHSPPTQRRQSRSS
ncbi:hypothetical protein DFJ74DRAFT_720478 [Hyaloraphidium curvatum]|nr:hypothetical protein DFJ74DRAFT_720478 [Hyaloraphidium curvatum]